MNAKQNILVSEEEDNYYSNIEHNIIMNSYVCKYEPSAKPHMLKYRAVTVLSFALGVREGL